MQARTHTDDVHYVPPQKPKVLQLRSTEEFEAKLLAVVRLWRLYAEARGDDADQIDRSYVMRTILENGVTQTFADFGGVPTSEEGWAAVEAAVAKSLKKSR